MMMNDDACALVHAAAHAVTRQPPTFPGGIDAKVIDDDDAARGQLKGLESIGHLPLFVLSLRVGKRLALRAIRVPLTQHRREQLETYVPRLVRGPECTPVAPHDLARGGTVLWAGRGGATQQTGCGGLLSRPGRGGDKQMLGIRSGGRYCPRAAGEGVRTQGMELVRGRSKASRVASGKGGV